MAGEAEQLVVSLEARIRDFERNMARAQRTANDNFTGIERRARVAGRNLENAMATSTSAMSRRLENFGSVAAGKLKGAFAAIAAGVTLNELRQVADRYTGIMNSLKVAGVKDADLSGVFDRLFASAQRNAVPLDALAQLYGRVSQAQTTLKASSSDILRITDIVAQSLRVAGKSASESSGALLQLAQAFSNGKVQAEEYNSLLDGAYPLLQAAAAGMQEAGGDVAKLTALVKDGKVSSEAFFRAIEAGAPILEEKLAGAALTSEQAWQKLQNELTKAVGEFDKATGASAALAGAIDGLAGSIGGIGRAAAGAVNGVQLLINKVGELAAANAGAQRAQALTYQEERARRTDAARDMGTANAGGRDALANERAAAERAAKDAARVSFRASENAFAAEQAAAEAKAKAAPSSAAMARVNPISLKNYAVPGDAGGSKGGGGGGGSGAEKQSRFDRDLEAIGRRTEALKLEAQMVGKGREEVEKAKIALQLEQAAKREGIAITDQMRSAIDAAATGYANAKMKVEDLKSALDGARDAQKFFAQEVTDGLTDMILEGKSAAEVIQNLAKALLKAALQAALMGSGPLAGLFGTKGAEGAVGGIFGLFGKMFGFAEGGFTGAGGKYEPAGIVHRGEYVVSKRAVERIGVGNLETLHRGALKGFDTGGFVGAAPLSAPSLPDAAGISATTMNAVNQNVTVNVTGGSSGDAKADQKFAELIGRKVQEQMKSMIGNELRQQLRPGGVLREAGR
ncbi:tape measure protein [Bosea sp. (in: a-proteobacteria)]|uniref:tape measure protein n=1 Tax=Bosea sp. (in: a-proteobacteria) TaxID=1871050 RepID=UPI001AC180E9|nr:tape measure protein [Bosea sp. (in: a-proteobacteria)]MBN9437036.1 tape measure protein [Bosea sp. (in: a-proteobacteria)]